MIGFHDLLAGNKARTKVFTISHPHIAHLPKQFNNVFAVLISLPRFKSTNFYQNRPKITGKLLFKIL